MKGYRSRKTDTRKPRHRLLIVCEGEKTERCYFRSWNRRRCDPTILVPDSPCTDPISLVKFAVKQIQEYGLDLKVRDRLWCVFDVDKNSSESIQEARRLAKNGARLGISNPSFEVWYLLHFKYWTHSIDNDSLIQDLKRYLHSYSKVQDYHEVLHPRTDTALRNAKLLNRYHHKNRRELGIDSNPSTQVFRIIEYIRSCK